MLVLASAHVVSFSADVSCDAVLVSSTRAELQQAGYEVRDGEHASLRLRCTDSAVTAHVEVPLTRTSVERTFDSSIATRALLAVKLSELVHRAMADEPRVPPKPVEPVQTVATPEPVSSQWLVGLGLGVLVSPNVGVTPGLTAHVGRRLGHWELGVLAESGLTFQPMTFSTGTVELTAVMGAFTLAYRFEVTSRLHVRALMGPSLLGLFASGTSRMQGVSSSSVAAAAFGATAGVMAEYEVASVVRVFLNVNATWGLPRPIIRAPGESRTVAEPLAAISLGVLSW